MRVKAANRGLVSKYANISTASYSDSDLGSNDVPIPFSVRNGVVDIEITNSSVQTFITNGNSPNEDSQYQAKSMGGYRLADKIGTNFATYLRNYITNYESLGSTYAGPLTVVVNGTMARVQIAQPGNVFALEFENVFGNSAVAPVSDSYAGGSPALNYYSAWVFESPMTIQYESVSGSRYITFTTHYDGN